MSNNLVMLVINEDGDELPDHERAWHIVNPLSNGGLQIFCTGEFFNIKVDDWNEDSIGGEGNAWAISKTTQRGGITCPLCLRAIKEIKSVKL